MRLAVITRLRLGAVAAAALVGGVLAGCDLEMDIEIPLPPHEPRLVVNALYQTGDPLVVHLGRSRRIGHQGGSASVEGGAVALFADGEFVEQLEAVPIYDFPDSPVRFVSQHMMQPERLYRVVAQADGLPPVWAEERSLPLPRFQVVSITPGNTTGDGFREDRVVLRLEDQPGRDFYRIGFHERFEDGSLGAPLPFRSDDPVLTNGQLFELFDLDGRRFMYRVLFSDTAFDGQTYTITLDVLVHADRPGTNWTRHLRVDAVPERYYRYARARQALQNNEGNPFAEPVILPTNVEGGLGIFTGRSGREVSVGGGS